MTLVSLLLFSCDQESIDLSNNSNSSIDLTAVKKVYGEKLKNNMFKHLRNEPLWEDVKTVNYNGEIFLEIPFRKIRNEDISQSTSISIDKLLASEDDINGLKLNIAHFFINNIEHSTMFYNDLNLDNLDALNGFLTIFDLNKQVLELKRYNYGKESFKEYSFKDNYGNTKNMNEDEECEEVTENIYTRTCYFWMDSDGNPESLISCTDWVVSDTYTYSACEGENGNTNSSSMITEEIQIIDDLLTGKAKCINDLLDKNGNNFIKDLLKQFEGAGSEFDIHIKSEPTIFSADRNEYVNGLTSYIPGQNVINIQISTDKLSNLPALAAARTLMHEYIHADILRKLYNKSPSNGELDFRETFNKYENEQAHNSMADLYVTSMRDALKDFHQDALIDDYNYLTNNGMDPLPDSFYEALAWQGLKEDNVQAYIDLGVTEKTELENSLQLYYHSTTKNCPE